jgi:hypothetical protein
MDRRHDDELTSRLEEIFTKGCTFISWNELYLWYDVQKIAARTYRDLSDRWDEIASRTKTESSLGKLSFVQSPMGRSTPGLFLFGSEMPRLISVSDD